MEKYVFRKAGQQDAAMIWEILQQAILLRAEQGSDQWQQGYPNLDVVEQDIENDNSYVLENDQQEIVGVAAVIFAPDPAYEAIKGKWLSSDPYVVIHRVAVRQHPAQKGIGTLVFEKIEALVRAKGSKSLRFDTNFDNYGMLKIAQKLGFEYCGEVIMSGGVRKAFEKVYFG